VVAWLVVLGSLGFQLWAIQPYGPLGDKDYESTLHFFLSFFSKTKQKTVYKWCHNNHYKKFKKLFK